MSGLILPYGPHRRRSGASVGSNTGGSGGGGTGPVIADYSPSLTTAEPLPADGDWWSFFGVDGTSADNSIALLSQVGTWRKKKVPGVMTWHDGDSLGAMNPWDFEGSAKYTKLVASHTELACGGLYAGETWQNAANGDTVTPGDGKFTARFTSMFNNYNTFLFTPARVAAGAKVLCRPFHEWNGDWYNQQYGQSNWWCTQANAAYARLAWARVWNLRNAISPNVKLGMSFNGETTTDLRIMDLIEVDANGKATKLDYLSVDLYNNAVRRVVNPSDWDAKAALTKTVNGTTQPAGFESWRLLALQLGVPLVISEWSNPAGLGEAPGFFDGFYSWLKLHGGYGPGKVWMEGIFNVAGYGTTPGPFGDYKLYDPANNTVSNNQPLSAAEYALKF